MEWLILRRPVSSNSAMATEKSFVKSEKYPGEQPCERDMISFDCKEITKGWTCGFIPTHHVSTTTPVNVFLLRFIKLRSARQAWRAQDVAPPRSGTHFSLFLRPRFYPLVNSPFRCPIFSGAPSGGFAFF